MQQGFYFLDLLLIYSICEIICWDRPGLTDKNSHYQGFFWFRYHWLLLLATSVGKGFSTSILKYLLRASPTFSPNIHQVKGILIISLSRNLAGLSLYVAVPTPLRGGYGYS